MASDRLPILRSAQPRQRLLVAILAQLGLALREFGSGGRDRAVVVAGLQPIIVEQARWRRRSRPTAPGRR